MKKFCIISNDLYTVRNLRADLLADLAEKSYQIHVLAPNITDCPREQAYFKQLGYHIHPYFLKKTGTNPIHDSQTIFSLYQQLKRIQPHKVLSYTIKPAMYGTLAAYMAGVAERYILLSGLGYAFQTTHTGYFKYIKKIFDRLFRFSLSKATRVIFQNSDDLALIEQLGHLNNVSTGVVSGSGVNMNHFSRQPLVQDHLKNNLPVFVMIARLLRDKGIYEYMEAVQHIKKTYPDAVFHLVGWIDQNPEAIHTSLLDDWIDEGLINYWGKLDDVRSVIAQSNIMVLPSYREGTPRSVLEAMAMGRAVITTNAPGCKETIVDGVNGYQVSVGSANDLAQAMQKIIIQPHDITRMGQASYDMVKTRYDVNLVNQHMIALMQC
ncbi:glycosyltransferase family 4 protein [Acinetobacter sp. B5B]|uniref:glycosyltransferase family 4 protein n=1 Tax=Acinetobacter baretiae TaxID=2605383 RepID=UPI0018C1EF55|nr:glycosyltransferase family 4 protein [Acinetobacter baretiae]MBF7683424.1 glycosyltransferase family 4 protein [Acinetobacter baretiae]